jgi:hypothetical protein
LKILLTNGYSNEELRNIYHYLVTIENTIQKEIRHVRGNKSHLDKMVPEQLSKVYSTKDKTALTFIDNVTRTIYDNSVITLTATFERIVFAKYRTAYGVIKSTINTHSKKPLNYFDSKERFVNDQIDRLSGILFLIENIIDSDLFNKLKIIKDHRNYIAHGKRDSQLQPLNILLILLLQFLMV